MLFLLMPVIALASENDWRVAKASSQVRYTSDQKQWTELHTGDVIPNRAWVSTGPRGRALLVRGAESIGFQPNTMASISTKSGSFLAIRKTEIYQTAGELDLEIEKLGKPHTIVQTPYLAAVVKGTVFHVRVGKAKATVSVDRGLVQVTSFGSGQQANVGPRQSATVDRKTGMAVAGSVSKPQIASVAPSVPAVRAPGMPDVSAPASVPAAIGQPGKAAPSPDRKAGGPPGKDSGGKNGPAGGSGQGNAKGDGPAGGKGPGAGPGGGTGGKGPGGTGPGGKSSAGGGPGGKGPSGGGPGGKGGGPGGKK